MMMDYAELATTTNFSFLRGASHPGHLVLAALALGHTGIGIADRNSVAGVVRAYGALRDIRDGTHDELTPEELAALRERAASFRLVVGARLVFDDGTPDILAYPANRTGWGRLCRLLTIGNTPAKKGDCILNLADLLGMIGDLMLIVMPGRRIANLPPVLAQLTKAAPGAVWLAAAMHRRGDDERRLARLRNLAHKSGVPLLAVNDVLYHHLAQRDLQDVLTCIREGATIETAGRRLEANAERHLKPPEEMGRLFRNAPEAMAEIGNLLAHIDFSLGQLEYEYPDEPVPPGWIAGDWLEKLTWEGAAQCYPKEIPEKVAAQLGEELALIRKLRYEHYFLTIHDIVTIANEKGILCQGRGSAANSAVCYVLGITAVDPTEHDLLFARFISDQRREPPDIDVDFEHERREEVIQHIYEKYGRHRAGIAATVIRYRPRSAIRDVGKALGLTEDVTARLADTVWGSWGDGIPETQIAEAGFDAGNPMIRRAVDLATRLLGFPRHLSQHVGGFVLAQRRLDELVPIGNAAMKNRTFIEWDKDDLDTLKLMKVDVLALGMLTCIRKAFDLIAAQGDERFTLSSVPLEDKAVYEMLQKGDSLGVFQVESRAQMNMLPRLQPREFYDLVIEVAIVRPGPIQGDMVHPYLRRRAGLEEVAFPVPASGENELHGILHRTLGVPLFQEQAMKLAMVAAEFTDVEANQLRRAMATFRNVGTIGSFGQLMIKRMIGRGYDPDFARRCFEQIKGFGSYGFPESHAASFAKLVYVSSWIKCHHPAVFACALLNSQPMGFYAPAQIVRDAEAHGVEVRAPDVNASEWDNTLEHAADGSLALRIGMRQIDGFFAEWGAALVEARGAGYASVETLARRTRLPARALRRLADADAVRSLGLDRRAALWAVRRLPDDAPLPLFAAAEARELGDEPDAQLPAMRLAEHVAVDYQLLRLSLKGHPMQFLRPIFAREGVVTCAETSARADGVRTRTAGIVLVRQRPGTGNAIFVTLEDETGITNVLLWVRLFEEFRREVMGARLMVVEGLAQRSPEGVVHLIAERVHDRSAELHRLTEEHDPEPAHAPGARHPRDLRIMPRSRDFH